MPVVSIIIPLHNKGPYIRKTLESVLAQTVSDWEALVIENHSMDDGPAQTAEIASREPRIRLIHAPPEVCGPGAARNLGIAEARGEWVLFLDSDDLIESNYFDTQLQCAHENPGVHMVVGSWVSSDATTNAVIGLRRPLGWQLSSGEVCTACFGCTPWALHAAIVRVDWLRPSRLWPVELDGLISEDLAFWFRVVLNSRIAWSDSVGAIYRENTIGSRNDSKNVRKWILALEAAAQVNLNTLKTLGLRFTPEMHESVIRAFEGRYRTSRKSGDEENAAAALSLGKQWLRFYSGCKPAIVARKLLGLKLTADFSELLQRVSWCKDASFTDAEGTGVGP